MNNGNAVLLDELTLFLNKNGLIASVTPEGDDTLILDFSDEKWSRHNRTARCSSRLKVSVEQSYVFITTSYQIDEVFTDEEICKTATKIESQERYACGYRTISSSPPYLILNYKAPLINGTIDYDAVNAMLSECNNAFVIVEELLWIE